MILDIDLGNTRLKWRETTSPQKATESFALPLSHIPPDFNLPVAGSPERIRIATVRGPSAEVALTQWSQRQFGITPEFARATAAAGGVTNAYEIPARLGVDRWLAMLAAFNNLPEGLVVLDFGSAITADGVSSQGRHSGGYIAPGLRMMMNSLLLNTELVRFEGNSTGCIAPGSSTELAVSSGVLAASVGFADEVWSRLSEMCGAKIAVVTGGDANTVAPHLRFPLRLVPDLVLDGLSLALP